MQGRRGAGEAKQGTGVGTEVKAIPSQRDAVSGP